MSVVELDVERAKQAGTNLDVKPETLLRLALQDCADLGNVTKAIVLLVREDGSTWSHWTLRANLTRAEEIAHLNVMLAERIEAWTR